MRPIPDGRGYPLILEIEDKSMSRRRSLKGIAGGLMGSFVSRNNDVAGYWGMGMLCLLSRDVAKPSITVELVGAKESSDASHFVVKSIAETYSTMLQTMLSRAKVNPTWVKQAKVLVEFGSSGKLPAPPLNAWGEPFICTLTILDDLGHIWSVCQKPVYVVRMTLGKNREAIVQKECNRLLTVELRTLPRALANRQNRPIRDCRRRVRLITVGHRQMLPTLGNTSALRLTLVLSSYLLVAPRYSS